ncbi:hypothetical protein EDD18DRAFT_1466404 [Armillaria luteobubalina]|uniref:Uncharacterized protein n=1 Tax=Armillaria luteobubalina TaxID=153913 RepID=A0AA39PQT1_9AGAR|nr:hypothetical protein EDD18DRAFT_1466404 [Armillaria luteobubalina]
MVSALSTAHPRHQELVECITSHFRSDLETIRILSLITRTFGTLTRDYIFDCIGLIVLPYPTEEPTATASNFLGLLRAYPSRACLVKAITCTPESLSCRDAALVFASLTSLQEFHIFQEDDDLEDPYRYIGSHQLCALSALPIKRLRLNQLRFDRFHHLHDLLCALPFVDDLLLEFCVIQNPQTMDFDVVENGDYLKKSGSLKKLTVAFRKDGWIFMDYLMRYQRQALRGLNELCFTAPHKPRDYMRISDLLCLCQDSVRSLCIRHIEFGFMSIYPMVLPIGHIETLRLDIDYSWGLDFKTVQWWVDTFEQITEPGPLRFLYINVTGRCSKENEGVWDQVDVSLSRDVFVHLHTVKLFVDVSGMREVLQRRLARLQSRGVLEVVEGIEILGMLF